MAGVRQQRTVRLDKRLDAPGRLVEAGGHRGHFIAARHFDPMGQVAGAEMLDPFLQGFEPPSEPAYRRPRTGGHGHEQQHQHHDEAHAASERPPPPWPEVRRAAGAVPASIRWRRRWPVSLERLIAAEALRPMHGACTGAHHPERATIVQRNRQAARVAVALPAFERFGGGDALAGRVIEGERQPQSVRPRQQRGGLLVQRLIDAGQRTLDQISPCRNPFGKHRIGVHPFFFDVPLEQPPGAECEQQQHRDDGEVDPQGQGVHAGGHVPLSASCFFANT